MDQVNELLEYWHDYPPVHLLLRMEVGYVPAKTALSTEAEVRELAAMFRRN